MKVWVWDKIDIKKDDFIWFNVTWSHSFSWSILCYWRTVLIVTTPVYRIVCCPCKWLCLTWHEGVNGVVDGCLRRGILLGMAFRVWMESCGSRSAGRKGLNFPKPRGCATCSAEHVAVHPNQHLGEHSEDEAKAQGDRSTTPRPHGTAEWQSINLGLHLSYVLVQSTARRCFPNPAHVRNSVHGT